MTLTIKMKPEAAKAWSGGQRSSRALQELGELLNELGLILEPMFPGVEHPDLSSYFTAAAQEPAKAAEIANRLLGNPVIEGAYVKPADEPP